MFHLDHDYYGFLGVGEAKTKNLILLVDDDFRDLISVDDDYGHRLQKIYKEYDKKVLATFADAKILLSNVLHPSSQTQQVNLVDKTHVWRHHNNALLNQENNTLTIYVDTNKSRRVNNGAAMPIHLNNTSRDPLFLTLEYVPKSIKGNAKFLAEIRESNGSEILWSSRLNIPDGQSKIRTFFLPSEVSNRSIELRLLIVPQGPGEHLLTIKNMRIT